MSDILTISCCFLSVALMMSVASAQKSQFNGLGMNLGNLSRLSNAKTRSISPENFTGEKGKGGMAIDGPAAKAARRRFLQDAQGAAERIRTHQPGCRFPG